MVAVGVIRPTFPLSHQRKEDGATVRDEPVPMLSPSRRRYPHPQRVFAKMGGKLRSEGCRSDHARPAGRLPNTTVRRRWRRLLPASCHLGCG
jgi:hypothetical protein